MDLRISTPSRPTNRAQIIRFGDGSLGIGLTDAPTFSADAGAAARYSTSVLRFNQLPDGSAGPAESSGRVTVGDLLVSVNGADTGGLSKDDVLSMVSSSGRPVELGFCNPDAVAQEAISPIPSMLASTPGGTTMEPRRRAQVYAKLV